MVNSTINGGHSLVYEKLNLLEKFVVKRSHPITLVFQALGVVWFGYFFWVNLWLIGALCFLLTVIFGEIFISRDKKFQLLLKQELNPLQKLMVYHAGVKNIIFHVLGFITYLLGCSINSVAMLLLAFTFAAIGNIFPWIRHSHQSYYLALQIDADEKTEEDDKSTPPV